MITIQRFASLACTLLGAATAAAVGCNGDTLTVGTNDAGAPPGPDGGLASADTNGVGQQCDAGLEAGVGIGTTESDSTIEFATCASGDNADNCAAQGIGLVGLEPAECSSPVGPVHVVASADDVKSLLVGAWYSCELPVFGLTVPNAVGFQFSADGRYAILFRDDQQNLGVTFPAGDAGVPTSGTFDVVDGSATYGPGSFELQLHPADGEIIRGQVVVNDSPRQFQFFPPNATSSVFSPAAPWSPRSGVCSCVHAVGTKVSPSDPTALAAAMTGKWIWCAGIALGTADLPMGIEFTSDGSWYDLEEDAAGNLTRSTPGTFHLVSTASLPGSLATMAGPEPLSLQLMSPTDGVLTQVAVTQNPRVLFLAEGQSPPGVNRYSILYPAP